MNKKASIFLSVIYVLLSIVLIWGMAKLGIWDWLWNTIVRIWTTKGGD